MGPSGSCKFSLLSALSGTRIGRLKLSGDLRADGVAVDKVEGSTRGSRARRNPADP